jgi:hypothetical protein
MIMKNISWILNLFNKGQSISVLGTFCGNKH